MYNIHVASVQLIKQCIRIQVIITERQPYYEENGKLFIYNTEKCNVHTDYYYSL